MRYLHTHTHTHTHTNMQAAGILTQTKCKLPLYINTTVHLAVSALASVLVYIAIYETKQLLHSFCSYFSGANHTMYIIECDFHLQAKNRFQ